MSGEKMKRMNEYSGGPAWTAFSMSRANYFVMPRRALCSMPSDWQKKFVDLMDELHETIDMQDEASGYSVNARDDKGRFTTDELAAYRHVKPLPLLKKKEKCPKKLASASQLKSLSRIYIYWIVGNEGWVYPYTSATHMGSVRVLIRKGYLRTAASRKVKLTCSGIALVERYG